MPKMIKDIFNSIVRKNPEQIAVVDGEKSFTYYELYLKKQELLNYLIYRLNLSKGEKIAVFLPNCVEFIFSFFAIAEIGAIFMPLNIHLKERELQYYVDKYHITAVITNSSLLPRWNLISHHLQEGRLVIIDELKINEQYDIDPISEMDDCDVSEKTCSDTEVLYLSTSGSTGTPKIVPRTHANMIAGAKNVAGALDVTQKDKFLSVVPFFHANGFANCMFLPMMQGATIVVMEQFSARKMLHILREEGITIIFGSPFIFSTITEITEEVFSFSSVRLCLSTGAPMPEAMRKNFYCKFGFKVRQLYGSSETGTISIQLGNLPEDEKSLGKPIKTVDVKIINKEGEVLPPHESGEIIVRSPAMTKGYVGESQLNKNVFHNGYFRTGDIGMFDGKGSLYISGRKKRVINAAGVKIDPVEIENVLVSFHKVRDAFVVGIKNRRGLEIIKAILVAQPDCKISEVIDYCKHKLADYKIPRLIVFKDRIPRDIIGKVVQI